MSSVSSICLSFSVIPCAFDFIDVILSATLLPTKSLVASAVLCTTFLPTVLAKSLVAFEVATFFSYIKHFICKRHKSFNNCPNDLFGTKLKSTLEAC